MPDQNKKINSSNPYSITKTKELMGKLRSMDTKMLKQVLMKQGYVLPKMVTHDFLNLSITGEINLIK